MTQRALSLMVTLISFLILLNLSSSKNVYSAFSISSISPQSISNPDEIITLVASGSSLTNKQQYLQVGITADSSVKNYFGFINSRDNNWFSYKSTITDSDLSSMFMFTPINGSWSGELKIKIDVTDSGFKGPGNYLVRLSRYLTTSANTTDFVNLNINYSKPVIVEVNSSPPSDSVSKIEQQTVTNPTVTPVAQKQTTIISPKPQVVQNNVLGTSMVATSAKELVATVNLGIIRMSSREAMQSEVISGEPKTTNADSKYEEPKTLDWYIFVVPGVGISFIFIGLLKYTYEYFKQRT